MTREAAIAEIISLKNDKPEGWQKQVRILVKSVWEFDHPKGEEHSEEYGRNRLAIRFSQCPYYDCMDDESDPDHYWPHYHWE